MTSDRRRDTDHPDPHDGDETHESTPEKGGDTVQVSRSSTPMPRRIGRYTIRGVIASGGMGTVYKAVQEQPRRAVAVKVMKAGMNSASELRRFEFEAQLLGRLRHPGIAQVYEAGTHEEGGTAVPYFAMEYIPNAKHILEHSEKKQLNTRERLELFQQVCEAVHHGHQKGIIHRDLKPDNILVGPNGNPHVIDFGVARATDSDMALTQHQTDLGQLIGTLQYMSPEQCEADPHDIDTRSDVYSLGVVLYELLCNQLPYDVSRVKVYEAANVIRTQDPPRPSKTNPKLRGDLETIVLKALEKDRDRRYQSAGELGQDIQRYLNGEGITARPASTVYQLKIFARRNKGFLAAASAVVVVLLAGVIVSSVLYVRSRTYEIEASAQESRAEGAHMYLEDVMSSLNLITGDEIPVSNLLETFEESIEKRFSDQPEVEAGVRLHLAQQYDFLSMFRGNDEAKKYANRARVNLDQALQIQRDNYGDHNEVTLATIEEFAGHLGRGFDLPRAEEMYREALAIRESLPEMMASEVMIAKMNLADVLIRRNKLDEAASLNAEALEFFQNDSESGVMEKAEPLDQRAEILQQRKDFVEAEAIRLDLLEAARKFPDPEVREDWEEAALRKLANLYVAEGKLEAAAEIYDTQISVTEDSLGVTMWIRKDHDLDPNSPTLLVFWEEWCPWCQLYLPRMDDACAVKPEGLQVIGLTSLSWGKTVKDATQFIERNDLDFVNAVTDPKTRDRDIGNVGYPHAIALHEGRVLWRGNPSEITEGFVAGLADRRAETSRGFAKDSRPR